jgi:hypothetical protein
VNLHLKVTSAEYRRIMAQAKREDISVNVHTSNKDPNDILFATLPVTLFVTPGAHYRKTAAIHNPTYSRDILRIDEEVKRHAHV